MAAGTPDFKKGETYILYVNGEEYTTFTIFDITTVVGNNASMGPGGAGGGRPRQRR